MVQAKSRLSIDRLNELAAKRHLPNFSFKRQQPNQLNLNLSHPIWQNYLTYWPTLVIGLFFILMIGLLVSNVRPTQIANIGLYHSYWPLLLLVFGAVFFMASFFLQNTRRGLLAGILVTTLLFLKLQSVVLSSAVVLTLAGVLIGIEIFLKIVIKR